MHSLCPKTENIPSANPHKFQFKNTDVQRSSPCRRYQVYRFGPSTHRGDANGSVNKTTIGADNGLSTIQRQASISTHDGLTINYTRLWTTFNGIWIQIPQSSYKKMNLKTSLQIDDHFVLILMWWYHRHTRRIWQTGPIASDRLVWNPAGVFPFPAQRQISCTESHQIMISWLRPPMNSSGTQQNTYQSQNTAASSKQRIHNRITSIFGICLNRCVVHATACYAECYVMS